MDGEREEEGQEEEQDLFHGPIIEVRAKKRKSVPPHLFRPSLTIKLYPKVLHLS
jgi:hypothetical protein